MAKFGEFIARCFKQKAQGMVEYAIVIAFVVGVAAYFISGTNPLGDAVNNSMDAAQQQLTSGSDGS